MIKIFRKWLLSLNGAERDLWDRGYIVIYGGGTSFVLPVLSNDKPLRQSLNGFTLCEQCVAAETPLN